MKLTITINQTEANMTARAIVKIAEAFGKHTTEERIWNLNNRLTRRLNGAKIDGVKYAVSDTSMELDMTPFINLISV